MLVFGSSQLQRIALIGGAVAVAALIGFVMQSGQEDAMYSMEPTTADRKARVEFVEQLAAKVDVRPEIQTVAPLPDAVTPIVPVVSTVADIEVVPVVDECSTKLIAAAGAAALIDVILNAPCHSDQQAVVHHEGMMFSIRLDDDGKASFKVPALKLSSFIMVAFSDGTTNTVEVETPSLAFYDRVVLQWEGKAGLQFHAFEYGASYGDSGHVWADTPQKISDAAAGDGGFLLSFGKTGTDDQLIAEVYTFPTGITHRVGDISMSVESEISDSNCGQTIHAQTLQFKAAEGLNINDLTLNLPGCDAIGEFLVLNNLIETMKLTLN